ncbi:hypothetical protein F01_421052 [Burkholderia cenocepacia]|nr:hypothetical protein F01_421052 [Burkholderia cenocepacia]
MAARRPCVAIGGAPALAGDGATAERAARDERTGIADVRALSGGGAASTMISLPLRRIL